MYFVQPSPLPPLSSEGSFDPSAVFEGAGPVTTSRLFEAKAVHLLPRPKTSLGTSRSSPGFSSASKPPPSPIVHTSAPRHDQDVESFTSTTNDKVEGARGDSYRSRKPSVLRWSPIRQGPTTSVGLPSSALVLQSPEGTTTPPEHSNKVWSDSSSGRGEIFRSDPGGGAQGRAQTVHVLRRSNSEASDGSSASTGGLAVTTSNDPVVLKAEIHRLQAAIMREFKGVNRFVGGAQFKASIRRQAESCGGCLQVREALRRSRVESRDLRGSLFRAEAVIRQLTLTKAARRARNNIGGTTADIDERENNAHYLGANYKGGMGGSNSELEKTVASSRERLLTRVQQLERELRLADFRGSRSMGATLKVGHGLSGTLVEGEDLQIAKGSPHEISSKREREDPHPCKECSELEERLLEEASKVNGLMRQTQEYKQEAKLQREDNVELESYRTQQIEMRRKVDRLSKQAEEQTRKNEKYEIEKSASVAEIERLVGELDVWRTQALEYDGQIRKLSDQYKAVQSEASVMTRHLEQAEKDLITLDSALSSERSLRKEINTTVGTLKKNIAKERSTFQEMKVDVTVARQARRRSESQAAATEVAHRRALKAALNSCVRLCVVAPTVNINLDDRSRSFCSGLPEEKIRIFVEGSVLPRFTRVLLQPGADKPTPDMSPTEPTEAGGNTPAEKRVVLNREDAMEEEGVSGKGYASDGQEDFDKWLKDLLVDMQTSIERHVANVFQTQTTGVDALAMRR